MSARFLLALGAAMSGASATAAAPPPPPLPPFEFGIISGTAVGVGRLWNCTVCQRPSVGDTACSEGSASAHTVHTGQYHLVRSQASASTYSVLTPGPECTDFMTGLSIVAPMRCSQYMCSVITDLHAELMYTHGHSSYKASSVLSHSFIGLASTEFVDIDLFDPTSAPLVAGHGGYASVMMSLAMRWADAWEWLACSIIHAAERRDGKGQSRMTADTAAFLDSEHDGIVVGDVEGSSSPGGFGSGSGGGSSSSSSSSSSGSSGSSGSSRGHDMLSSTHAGRRMAGVTATAGLNLMGPRAAAVSTFMRRRLASLLTEGRMLTSAAALTPAGASLLAELFSTATLDAAGSIGLRSLKAEDVAAPAAAFAAFVGATSVDVKADLGGWQVTIDEWHAAHASLALASWVSRVLNQKTSDLILGRMTKHAYVAENTRAAISLRLQETAESKATADGLSIRVMCLDPKASTYSPHGELHQQSQCMYSESETVKAFLSMDGAEWAYFILSCTSAAWLIMTLSVSLTAILHVLPRIKARNAAPVESWPHVAVLVPCYMPNEQVKSRVPPNARATLPLNAAHVLWCLRSCTPFGLASPPARRAVRLPTDHHRGDPRANLLPDLVPRKDGRPCTVQHPEIPSDRG